MMANLDTFYETPDPWGYQSNPDDIIRKRIILDAIGRLPPLTSALDIAAGEGWITGDIPAKDIWGFEQSDLAAARFPKNVGRVMFLDDTRYDLVCCMGALYEHYDWKTLMAMILTTARRWVLVAGIDEWLVDTSRLGKVADQMLFPYREFEQMVIVYDTGAA